MATQILGKVAYTSRGAYDSSFSYEINDVVTYKGSSYVSKKETKGNLPTNEEYWMLLAEKGATYQVTEEDLKNIANEITADANSAFNQNVTSKTNAFDANATSQTSAFNNNANAKTTSYNDNATSALSAYNTNANSKLNAYDKNHNEKVEAYNTNASAKLKEFNDNAESYDERIADNTNRTKRIENTLYDSGEANGTSINIKDSTLAEFQEITIDGVCKQTTTTGKNLLPISKLESKTINGITFSNNQDGTYTLKGTATSLVNLLILENKNETVKLENNEYYSFSFKVLNGNLNFAIPCSVIDNDGTITYNYFTNATPTKLTDKEYMINNVSFYITSGQNVNCTIAIQLEKNSTVTEYEPYTGGQASPSPSYPQPIEVIDEGFDVVSCNVNAMKLDLLENVLGYHNTLTIENGIIQTVSSGNYAYRQLKYLIPTSWIGKKVVFSFIGKSSYHSSNTRNQVSLTNIEDVDSRYYGSANLSTTEEKHYTISFTPESKEIYMSLYSNLAEENENILYIKEVQLQLGDKATPFEEHQETRVPINLPDGEFVGKINENAKDQVRIAFNEENGEYKPKLSKKLGIKVLNGTEKWITPTSFSYGLPKEYFPNAKLTAYKTNEMITSHYRVVQGQEESVIGTIWVGSSNVNFNYDNTSTNLEGFKQALSESPITVIYELDEPYEIDLGVVDMPLSYSPETNVFTTSELEASINAKYYRNFINTIQNLQVNEKALKDELVDINSRLTALEANLVNMASVEEVESEVVE